MITVSEAKNIINKKLVKKTVPAFITTEQFMDLYLITSIDINLEENKCVLGTSPRMSHVTGGDLSEMLSQIPNSLQQMQVYATIDGKELDIENMDADGLTNTSETFVPVFIAR